MSNTDSDFIKRMIRSHTRRLQKLKEMEAFKGRDIDPATLIEIEEIEEKIAALEAERSSIESKKQEEPSKTSISDAVRRDSQISEDNKRIERSLEEINARLKDLYEKNPIPKDASSLNDLSNQIASSPNGNEAIILSTSEIRQLKGSLLRITNWLDHLTADNLSVKATGIIVITTIITSLPLNVEGDDIIKSELKWLFAAVEHFLRFQQGQIERSKPVDVQIPPYAESIDYRNSILVEIEDSKLQDYEYQVRNLLIKINQHLDTLNLEWNRMAQLAGSSDVDVRNSIKFHLREIIRNVKLLADYTNSIYGVMIYTPKQLTELFDSFDIVFPLN